MKRLLFSFLALFIITGFVFGQFDTSTVTVVGPNNMSYVNQSGLENFSNITQTGNFNFIDLTHPWTSTALSYTFAGGVVQLGEDNIAQVSQWNDGLTIDAPAGPRAGIRQIGDDNNSTIQQTGAPTTRYPQGFAYVEMNGNDNTSFQSQVLIGYEFSFIYQSGNENKAISYQSDGYDNKVADLQSGNNNYIYNDQGLASGYDKNNWARTRQYGNFNWAALSQNGNISPAYDNHADIYMSGDHNTVQGLTPLSVARSQDGSLLEVDMVGSNNTLWLDQVHAGYSVTNIAGSNNTSTVIQN